MFSKLKSLAYKSFNKNELILLPLLGFVFWVTYHYYGFYLNDFKKIFHYVQPSLQTDQYDRIEQFKPFYPIYKIAKEVKNPEDNIIYVRTKIDKKNKQYLHELFIEINYAFYPHIIKPHTIKELAKMNLSPGKTIISDTVLNSSIIPKRSLIPVVFSNVDVLDRFNRKVTSPYYLYQVQ